MAITVTLQPDSTTGIDCFLDGNNPNTNNYTGTAINVGLGATAYMFMALNFNLSMISRKSKILAATLVFYCQGVYGTDNRSYYVKGIIENWLQTQATWNVRLTGIAWSTIGFVGYGQDASSDAGMYVGAESVGSKSVRVPASYVQGILEGTYFGFAITAPGQGGAGRYSAVTSCEGATAANRPKLTITYEPYHKVLPISAGYGGVR